MALVSICLLSFGVAALLLIKYIESQRLAKRSTNAKLPGPKGLPLIGNVHQLPNKCSWLKFHEWAETYGPIYQVNLAGTNHVWLSRDKVAHDLLSKRSAIYSDRPFIPALEHDNRTSGQYLPLMSKNLLWSRQRRFAKQIMDKSQKDSYYSYPELEAIRLLFELIGDPSTYNTAMESYVARITSRLAWGTSTAGDELKQRARELLIGVSPTGALGNKLPGVMSLPEKLSPARAWESRRGRTERKFFETMQEEVQESLDDPTTRPSTQSWTRMFLENKSSWGFSSNLEGAYAVGMHGIAGALTIAAPMQSFCLALCYYPEYQPMLHEEIDRVLGDRMPTCADMPEMPILRAFIRETLRWRPPVPTGIPHALTQDDIYEGYHIPQGSVIHPLEWSISRDPAHFPDPDVWNPLRWLEPKYPTYQEPLTKYPTITQYSQFGYGRRVCQGMGVAEADLFVGLGSVAWLFSMSKDQEPAEEQANEIETAPMKESVPDDESSIPLTPLDTKTTPSVSSGLSSRKPAPSKLAIFSNDSAISLPRSEDIMKHADLSSVELDDETVSATIAGQIGEAELQRSGSFASSCDELSPIDFRSEIEDLELEPVGTWAHYAALRMKDEMARRASSDSGHSDECASAVNQQDITSDQECHDVSEAEINTTPGLPGAWNSPLKYIAAPAKASPAPLDYDNDPTLNFSTLLIAKPLPFKFNLRIRNQARAEQVTRAFLEQKLKGEFEDARVFWKNGNEGDAEVGWGKVFV